jgi:type VI secretion system protein ImpC
MPIFTDDNETKVKLETGGNALPDEMPFRLLFIGDWSGRASRTDSLEADLRGRKPLVIDRDNYEEVMRRLKVELALDLESDGRDVLQLRFTELDDFHPDRIFHQVPLFASLRDTRKRLMNSDTFNSTAREVREWLGETAQNQPVEAESLTSQILENRPAESAGTGSFLDQILSESGASHENRSKAPATASRELNKLLGDLVRPFLVQTDEAEQSKLVAAVDSATGELMRKILHHPQFQALESAWRGVYLLVSRIETDADLKLYLLDATKDELKSDLKSVGNLSESAFYKLLNEETPGNYVDESWAAVFADFAFNPDVDDVAALMRVAEACADSDTPFIAQASAKILGVESLADAPDPREWRFSEVDSAEKLWTMLRDLPEAAYLGLTIPRLMLRMPYGEKNDPTENFSFEELDAAPVHNQYLWANSIFACAVLLAESFRSGGWEMERFAQDLENLPVHIYKEAGETKIKPGAELVMTQNAAEKIMEHGLMPLISFKDSDRVRLARLQSISSNSSTLRGKWVS